MESYLSFLQIAIPELLVGTVITLEITFVALLLACC